MNIFTTFREFLNENINNEDYTTLVKNLMDTLENEFDVDLYLYYSKSSHVIIVSKIVIDKQNRSQGIGSKVMNKICEFADLHKLRIALTPSSDFGGSKSRLIQFYRSFGFKPYKGYDFREARVRLPQ